MVVNQDAKTLELAAGCSLFRQCEHAQLKSYAKTFVSIENLTRQVYCFVQWRMRSFIYAPRVGTLERGNGVLQTKR